MTTDDVNALRVVAQELEQRLDREAQRRAASERMCMRLMAILDNMPDLVAMADADGSLVYLNPAGRGMAGLAADDDVSRFRLSHCSCNPCDPLAIDRIAAPAREETWKGESTFVNRAGAAIPTLNVLIAHRNPIGEPEGLSTIVRDISERARVEGALRRSREELQRLSASHMNMQEDERKRIASDLHDGLGQALSLIKLSIEDVARQLSAGAAADATEALRRLVPNVMDVLHEVRRISMALRPSTLDDLGILATLSWYFRELAAVCHDVAVHKAFDVTEDQVPGTLKLAIYRIVQEATHNVLKHAKAGWLRVSLTQEDGTLQLRIEDDGCGFDPEHVQASTDDGKGLGLLSMKERAALSEGTFELRSAPARGTCIRVTWPSRLEVSRRMRG